MNNTKAKKELDWKPKYNLDDGMKQVFNWLRALRKKSGGLNLKTAEIKDQIPYGGTYRYKTNPNMTGDWLIGGSMKVNRVLPRKEVNAINKRTGVYDLPTYENLQKILQYLESTMGK